MYPGPEPRMRASDDDRRRVVAALERHTAAGRLSLDEYAERVSRAYGAATHHDLEAITADLPPEPAAGTVPSRQLLVAFLLAMAVLAALFVLFALLR
jgi:hypothetical protein